ncbi:MAG: alpha/beta fold hydrolase [Cryobacterium sp.]|nr:alpha/beta fold hydrolase [Oligoflexia bacterium]
MSKISCRNATEIHLARLSVVIQTVRVRLQALGINPSQVTLIGHSYGGHLVNLLATEDMNSAQVDSMVSISGVWKPWSNGYSEYLNVDPDLAPVDRQPKISKHLTVIHSVDDETVPIEQMRDFIEWVKPLPRTSYSVLELKHGGHAPGFEDPSDSVLSQIVSAILKQSRPTALRGRHGWYEIF